ncbi:potassium transporter-domain-containing protein [Ilyonectria sp. MPI-CAGE-AT-0026]|nr:potassium transporter-domain-containing protein [Ilyonectria sp. MPI-CAGE-AT-0026]
MAKPDGEGDRTPGKTRFDAVHEDGAIVGESSSAAAKDKIWDMDSEEKARRIADEDLNHKTKQDHRGFLLLWLTWQSTGTVYGDIGTSPLYVYSSTFSSQPSWDDLVGALSIIIWSLTLIVTIKYCFIVLFADDDGQGGTFALYSLLARYANIVRRDPNVPGMMRLDRHRTGDMTPVDRSMKDSLEKSRVAQSALKVIGIFGVSMVMADGVLMPAQSVLGAVQGITVANAQLTTRDIVGISCAILIVLFLAQPFGTARLGTSFAPIVVVWLLFNLCSGIYNLALHDYTVLKALSPHYAFVYLVRNGSDGWKSLGGLLLAFTGVEALFANLGAFGKRAIQLSWLCLAYPCLVLTYAGQAAYISADESQKAFTNPFFNTVPPGSFYFSMVIAVLAAIVASQAMITSSFQLTSQVMRLSYFPHVKTVHTSRKFHGQVYMPLVNWLLMIGTVMVTTVYNNTTSLGNAYGVCVVIVTFITTCMISLVAIIVWRIPALVVLFFFLIFAALDGAFMSSALRKVPEGAWFTIVLAVILSIVFFLWRFGKEQQWAAEAEDRISLSHLLQLPHGPSKAPRVKQESLVVTLSPSNGPGHMSTVSGLGVFFDKAGGGDNTVPKVFARFVRKFKARPEVIVFFHVRTLSVPTVPPAERFIITRVTPAISSCYRLTLRHGYMDDVPTPDLERIMVRKLMKFITRGGGDRRSELLPAVREEVEALCRAQDAQIVYMMGKQVMKIRRGHGSIVKWAIRKLALEAFLWIRENSRTKMADLDIDVDNLIEIGFVKEI